MAGRLYFVDNLRWSMIVLVVVMHASITYGPIGSWFFRDPVGATETSNMVLVVVAVFSQAFFMGLLFLLSGYFVPASYRRKGRNVFLKERAVRLGAPALLFILAIAPPMNYLLHQQDLGESFPEFYAGYLLDAANWDTGPLWFTLALLLFTIVWVAVVSFTGDNESKGQVELRQRHLVFLVLFMACSTFVVRIFFPIGTDIWNMQLCFFTQYACLFAFGILAFSNNWLLGTNRSIASIWKLLAVLLAVFAFPALLVAGGALEGDLTPFEGGLHWQALALALWEQAFCVAMCVSLIHIYRERCNWQGRLSRFLTENSYAVYVLHAPIVVGIAVLLSHMPAPILLRFLVLSSSAVLVTYGVAGVLRRLPLLKSIL